MRAIFYHSVTERRDMESYYGARAIEVGEFEAHVSVLARRWHPVSLEEVRELLTAGRPLPARAVHVSFDDGFRNNLLAAEILAKHRVPWTLFAVVDAVIDGFRPWYVRVADAVDGSRRRVKLHGVPYDLSRIADRHRLSQKLKSEIMAVSGDSHMDRVDELLSELQLGVPTETAWPFLSVAQLSELAVSGVEIGAHTASHPNLVRCSDVALHQELVVSKARLESALSRPVRCISYPDGRYDSRVLHLAAQNYELGMATWNSRHPTARYELRRFSTGPRVEHLEDVLSASFPTRFRLRRVRRAVRRTAKDAVRWLGRGARPA